MICKITGFSSAAIFDDCFDYNVPLQINPLGSLSPCFPRTKNNHPYVFQAGELLDPSSEAFPSSTLAAPLWRLASIAVVTPQHMALLRRLPLSLRQRLASIAVVTPQHMALRRRLPLSLRQTRLASELKAKLKPLRRRREMADKEATWSIIE
ncbi:hypothetical protein OPV22_034168 [Ensete ventricosum]|uniref:Uncharacterized protein n=1 Tax=Ensete ventricosum TaxID=4639 RepID=A0AAV8Q099_ENSVE|nr:hypothetical protein OPV22_034168 [Ensete ventricosum]